jgi:hypothetical protein
MSRQTVAEFSAELRKSSEVLLEQLRNAGINKTSDQDVLTDQDKQQLFSYLQSAHVTGEKKKITLIKKSTTEIKQADATGKARTIAIELRKKRTLIKRDDATDVEDSESEVLENPSKLYLRRIQATAFKAFRSLDFDLQGLHLLAYGANGAGKSSLYWLLYTFLQSGEKQTEDVAEYFDFEGNRSLLNIHSTSDEKERAHITLTLKADDGTEKPYCISVDQHETLNVPDILKADAASDFLTYRILLDFYRSPPFEGINLWSVFEKEILPFCRVAGQAEARLALVWKGLREERDAIASATRVSAKKLAEFEDNLDKFSLSLADALRSIGNEAQQFYDRHFSSGDVERIFLAIGMTDQASYDINTKTFKPPQIGFGIKLGEKHILTPHTFLNEAKLTQLALSVRFGATLSQLRDSPMKLLVLDDLLISLTLDNRMKVVDIILGETFAEYQKIILTHDRGFYQEFKRRIGPAHTAWSFQCFKGKPNDSLRLEPDKTDLQKAETHLAERNFDVAAWFLRKATEAIAKRYRESFDGKALPPGEFVSLSENLNVVRKKLSAALPTTLYEKVLKGTPPEHRALLLSDDDRDLDGSTALSLAEKRKLKAKRRELRQVLTHDGWAKMEVLEIFDSMQETTDRVLNPASHSNEVPLYEEEVRRAKTLIERLEQVLLSAKP